MHGQLSQELTERFQAMQDQMAEKLQAMQAESERLVAMQAHIKGTFLDTPTQMDNLVLTPPTCSHSVPAEHGQAAAPLDAVS